MIKKCPAGVVDGLERGPAGVGEVVAERTDRPRVDPDVTDLDRRTGHSDVAVDVPAVRRKNGPAGLAGNRLAGSVDR